MKIYFGGIPRYVGRPFPNVVFIRRVNETTQISRLKLIERVNDGLANLRRIDIYKIRQTSCIADQPVCRPTIWNAFSSRHTYERFVRPSCVQTLRQMEDTGQSYDTNYLICISLCRRVRIVAGSQMSFCRLVETPNSTVVE